MSIRENNLVLEEHILCLHSWTPPRTTTPPHVENGGTWKWQNCFPWKITHLSYYKHASNGAIQRICHSDPLHKHRTILFKNSGLSQKYVIRKRKYLILKMINSDDKPYLVSATITHFWKCFRYSLIRCNDSTLIFNKRDVFSKLLTQ